MGGVDLIDGLIGRYKIPVKSNKYTNRLFTHMLDLVMNERIMVLCLAEMS